MSSTKYNIWIFYVISALAFHIAISTIWLKWCGYLFSILGILFFIVVQGISLQLSFSTLDLLFSILLPFKRLSKLAKIKARPKVAILYTVCDDLFVDALSTLTDQEYSNYQVFVLDDSESIKTRNAIDRIAKRHRFIIVRRGRRSGFKAGNLNNWLKLYHHEFPYFIIVDSDSKLPPSFINEILKYAEHPSNTQVIAFQSKVLFWNTHIFYPRIMNITQPVSNFCFERLSQWDLTYSCFGHNCLYRTKELFEIGGFPEDFVAEDFAVQLRLGAKGYYCRAVDVVSYEAHPQTLQKVRRRMQRWAAQTLQLLRYPTKGLPASLIVASIKGAYQYLVWPFYLLGFGLLFASAILMKGFNHASFVDSFLIGVNFYKQPVVILLVSIFLAHIIIRGYLSSRLKVKLNSYILHCFYTIAEGFYLMVPMSYRVISYLFFGNVKFDPTQQSLFYNRAEVLWQVAFAGMWLIAIVTILSTPSLFLLNAFWLIPALFSPLLFWKLIISKG